MPDPVELFDITLDEVSLVDKGDCPEARIVFFKRDGGRIDKARFNEFLRARLTDRVLSEIQVLAGTLGDAVAATVFNNEGADAVRENLSEFTTAVEAVIDAWASEAGTVEKVARTKRVGTDDVTSLAMRAISKLLEEKGSDQRRSMTTPIRKKSDAYADAERRAARAFPDEANPQVRMHKFMQTPAGKEAYATYAEAAPDPAPAPEPAPVLKGSSALTRATAEAKSLMKSNPAMFPSLEAARRHVWKSDPELREQYNREFVNGS